MDQNISPGIFFQFQIWFLVTKKNCESRKNNICYIFDILFFILNNVKIIEKSRYEF